MYNLNQSIKKVFNYTYLKNNKNIIHICYGINDNFARCTATSIASLCTNNININFTFHILADSLSTTNKNKFKSLAKQYSIKIKIYEIDIKYLEQLNLPTRTHWPLPTYFRFLLPLYINDNDINKLIYLDADIFCLNDAKELFNIDINDYIIAAVAEEKPSHCIELNIPKHRYFNAGMLVINLKLWNKFNISETIFINIQKYHRLFSLLDQDALNYTLTGKVKYIEEKFNWFNWFQKPSNNSIKNIVLIHFGSHPKPWHYTWYTNPHCNKFNINIYSNYEKLTPWKNTPLEMPKKSQDLRCYSTYLLKHFRIIDGIYWYLKYLKTKWKL
ncbi:glycosyltransferase family 8 protein [Megamonas funiformis]|uniref:glycosyltransferase family 8 protein n=1 Tax=Megamonas funiformis TaxID=437897 RepID=UPI0026DCEFB2|nr:glycosyltransferase [Megamonas funiformis]